MNPIRVNFAIHHKVRTLGRKILVCWLCINICKLKMHRLALSKFLTSLPELHGINGITQKSTLLVSHVHYHMTFTDYQYSFLNNNLKSQNNFLKNMFSLDSRWQNIKQTIRLFLEIVWLKDDEKEDKNHYLIWPIIPSFFLNFIVSLSLF